MPMFQPALYHLKWIPPGPRLTVGSLMVEVYLSAEG